MSFKLLLSTTAPVPNLMLIFLTVLVTLCSNLSCPLDCELLAALRGVSTFPDQSRVWRGAQGCPLPHPLQVQHWESPEGKDQAQMDPPGAHRMDVQERFSGILVRSLARARGCPCPGWAVCVNGYDAGCGARRRTRWGLPPYSLQTCIFSSRIIQGEERNRGRG